MSELTPHFGYQVEGIARAQGAPTFIYRIPPGGGKTRMACEVARGLGETSILWLSPPTPVPHIVRQIQRWGAPWWRVAGVRYYVPSKADVLVVPYSRVIDPVIHAALMARRFDRIVIDEAHYIKNPRTERTRAIYGKRCAYMSGGLIDVARRAIVMSGTLAPNGTPVEIYPHLRALFPKSIMLNDKVMGETTFANRYTEGMMTKQGWKTRSTRGISELMSRLAPFLMNVPQSVVNKELPPFSMDTWYLDEPLSNELALMQQDKRVWELADFIKEHGKLPSLDHLGDLHIASLLRLTGLAKLPSVLEEAKSFLQQTSKKLVLFAKHVDVVKGLHDNLTDYNPVMLYGATGMREREARISEFIHFPKCRVFVAQMDTAGTGYDLVCANDVWFAELNWNPSVILQAAKRLHRPGQKNPVQCRLFSLQGTLDDAVESVITRKTASIREAFQD